MAELVQKNMEEMANFLEELKKHLDDDKIKEIVNNRRHFEYKIASKARCFDSFISYIDAEIENFNFIKKLKLSDSKTLITDQKKLVERLLKQVTTHFQSEPKAFFLALKITKIFENTNLEKAYWMSLLKKHGHKNPKFYVCAAYNAMHKMLPSDLKYQDIIKNKKFRKLLLEAKRKRHGKIDKRTALKKGDIEQLDSETKRAIIQSRIKFIEWTRNVLIDGIKEFPKNKYLFESYLSFEISNYNYLQSTDEQTLEILGDCGDGKVINIILTKILAYFATDLQYLKSIIDKLNDYAPSLQLESIDKISNLVRDCQIVSTVTPQSEPMEIEDTSSFVDHYAVFHEKYPQPIFIRAMSPSLAAAGGDLLRYLEALEKKLVDGEVLREIEMPKIRKLLDCVLSDDDWSKVSFEIWWQYCLLEKRFGDCNRFFEVFRRAESKLNDKYRPLLTLRKLKLDRNQ